MPLASLSKILLIVLDGFGIGKTNEHNAIYLAKTPFYDSLLARFPHTELTASGEAVGVLPEQIGGSEIGHLHLGAGRLVRQDIARIHQAIDRGEFFENPALINAIAHAKKHGSTLHLVGLLSPGGVHAHTKHLYELLELAKRHNLPQVAIHAFLDGRDTPPASALQYVADLEAEIMRLRSPARLATTQGRFFGMDRNQNWERTLRAFALLTKGEGQRFATAQEVVAQAYQQDITDEFIEPSTLVSDQSPLLIKDNDSIVFFNFRADRMRQLVTLFLNHEPSVLRHSLKNLHLTSMAAYVDNPQGITVAYPDDTVRFHLSEVLSTLNIPQFKIAEMEKYAHLTYFFNGGRETPYPKEERLMIPSGHIKDWTQTPQMASPEITKTLLPILARAEFPFVAVNLCNADMLGHTGNIAAAIKGVECLDQCLRELVTAAKQRGYATIITADHGNAEEMYLPDLKSTHTAHTLNKVPCILISDHSHIRLKADGTLSNLAPTILELMNLPKPAEMVMPSLIF